jgi:membrane protease YdiL (CAAX protease family)
MAMFSLKEELKKMWRFLQDYRNEAIVIGAAMLFISLHRYHIIWNEWFSDLLYYAIFPILITVILLRKNPFKMGLGWGESRVWWPYVGIVCLISAMVLFPFTLSSDLQDYYRMENFAIVGYSLTTCVQLLSSEFFFRGFLIFGLKDKFKEGSILIQMIPFVMVHLGKPEIETLSTILTGLLFGYIAYKGNSFWPAFFIHMFINLFFVVIINLVWL